MDGLDKILIIRLSSIGDVVLTTPIVRCLKNKYPKSEIHFITKKNFKPVLIDNPYIDNIIEYESIDFNKLKQSNYNIIIDLHKNLRSFSIKRKLNIESISFDKLNFKKWLLCKFKIDILPDKHLVDRYFDSLKLIGITDDKKGCDYFNIANSISPVIKYDKYVCIVLGAQHFTKQMPIELIIDIIDKSNHNFVLIGGKNEIDLSNRILNEISDISRVESYVGKTTISESSFVLKKSLFVITPDTGMMHIASALNCNIISVWGNTVPKFGMFPYMPMNNSKFHIVQEKIKCRPCSKIGFDKCPKNHFDCMKQIKTSEILKLIDN